MPYITFTIPKKSGGVRTITAPDAELKERQRDILKILEKKEWLSRHCHGFRKGKGIVTNAKVHCGKKYVLNIDVKDFFPSIRHEAGGWDRNMHEHGPCFHNMVLPQGAPTSPYLSNIYMRDFDTQIVGLLREYVSDDIQYSRYADDLTFSSNSKAIEAVVGFVTEKLRRDLSLTVNTEKTHLMKPGQRKEVTGLNVNSGRPTISKKYRKEVRALVHRAATCGWIVTKKQYDSIMGKIAYISMCHPEEAKGYREMMLKVVPVKNDAARRVGVKRRIRYEVKGHHRKEAQEVRPSERSITRKIRLTTP